MLQRLDIVVFEKLVMIYSVTVYFLKILLLEKFAAKLNLIWFGTNLFNMILVLKFIFILGGPPLPRISGNERLFDKQVVNVLCDCIGQQQ